MLLDALLFSAFWGVPCSTRCSHATLATATAVNQHVFGTCLWNLILRSFEADTEGALAIGTRRKQNLLLSAIRGFT